MRLGIIGYGTIGRMVAEAIQAGKAGDTTLVAVLDIHDRPPFDQVDGRPVYTTELPLLLDAGPDVVLEAASQAVLRTVAFPVLERGKSLVAMSVGAFADLDFAEALRRQAAENGGRVYLPSGAIGGLDALAAAAIEEIDAVTLTTTKPVKGLAGARSAFDPDLDLTTITEATCIYEGPAAEAVQRFPQNVNVAAALSLAGIGFQRTTVRVVADPRAERNVHRIDARGRFGELSMEFRNLPSPGNPKTSYLAALSAIGLIRRLGEPIRVGA
jgi:aspartate dehydrogenase